MKDRLTALFELQSVDSQLDELESLRGDLPTTVQELERELNEKVETIEEKLAEIEEAKKKKTKNEHDAKDLLEQQKKFKAQLYQVRNNKEYDALTKEIDYAEDKIETLDSDSDALIKRVEQLEEEIEELKPLVEEKKSKLDEKNENLKKIVAENEKEEARLQKEREKLVKNVRRGDYSNYTRIRRAKKGLAVATISRSACSGCHNIVPPQRQLEIRRNNRLFFCEHCGRILVSVEVAEEAKA
ncbi:MAG: hypothetical protein GF419_12175 [Ignavibacteriales bacterium]|nr:hypothetical protein [Ignavibacteriales bacterium]